MFHKILLGLILTFITLSSYAFTVNNETHYLIKLNVSFPSWWSSEDFEIFPMISNFEKDYPYESERFMDFDFDFVEPNTREPINQRWRVYWQKDTEFHFVEVNGIPFLTIDDKPVV